MCRPNDAPVTAVSKYTYHELHEVIFIYVTVLNRPGGTPSRRKYDRTIVAGVRDIGRPHHTEAAALIRPKVRGFFVVAVRSYRERRV